MEKNKKSYQLETTSELQMAVGISKTTTIDNKGRHPGPDEIYFLIDGYDPSVDEEIECVVSVSKDEARKLSKILNELSTDRSSVKSTDDKNGKKIKSVEITELKNITLRQLMSLCAGDYSSVNNSKDKADELLNTVQSFAKDFSVSGTLELVNDMINSERKGECLKHCRFLITLKELGTVREVLANLGYNVSNDSGESELIVKIEAAQKDVISEMDNQTVRMNEPEPLVMDESYFEKGIAIIEANKNISLDLDKYTAHDFLADSSYLCACMMAAFCKDDK